MVRFSCWIRIDFEHSMKKIDSHVEKTIRACICTCTSHCLRLFSVFACAKATGSNPLYGEKAGDVSVCIKKYMQ